MKSVIKSLVGAGVTVALCTGCAFNGSPVACENKYGVGSYPVDIKGNIFCADPQGNIKAYPPSNQ